MKIKFINDWLDENIFMLVNTEGIEQLENQIWGFIKSRIRNKDFRNLNQPQYLDNIYTNWLNNKSYVFIYEELASLNIRMGHSLKQGN